MTDTAKLVVMGRIAGPYGVHGWVNVHPFTGSVDALLAHRRWWVGKNLEEGTVEQGTVQQGTAPREIEVLEGRVQGDHLVVQFVGCVDRDQAFLMKGLEVAVPRSHLPAPGPDEVYWADLIGAAVENTAGEGLGTIVEVFSNGSHPVLRVREGEGQGRGGVERLIPFIEQYVREVDVPVGHVAAVDGRARKVRVDWERDW